MKKVIILLVMTFLLTGCETSYDLNIKDYSIEEKITINVPSSLDSNSKSIITDFIESEAYPLLGERNDKIFYDIYLEDSSNGYSYTLNYKYKNNEIKNSKIINECFSNPYIKETDEYYMFAITGKFKCMNKNKKVLINIKTENTMYDHNADKNDILNRYTWEITDKNKDNVNIKFVVIKDDYQNTPVKKASNFFINILFTLIIILIILSGIFFAKRFMKAADTYIK